MFLSEDTVISLAFATGVITAACLALAVREVRVTSVSTEPEAEIHD